MTKPPIVVTNVDKRGNVTDSWHVKIGKRWRTFNAQAWAAGGLKYLNDQLKKARSD